VVLHRQAHLLELINAGTTPRRFTGGLNRGQQECHQDAYDGNDHQEFHQSKTTTEARREPNASLLR
jgi:hypothetical protein